MFTLLMRKMRNTKWMVLCLLIGFIMASAMTSTIPIYMNASLQRMLTKDMESFQHENDIFPGIYYTEHTIEMDIPTEEQLEDISNVENMTENGFEDIDCPSKLKKEYIADKYLAFKGSGAENLPSKFTLGGMSELAENSKIISGRMFKNSERSGDVYECVVSAECLKESKLEIDKVYELSNSFGSDKQIKIQIVGVIDVIEDSGEYWSDGIEKYKSVLLTDLDTVKNDLIKNGLINASYISVRYIMDYSKMNMNSIGTLSQRLSEQKRFYDYNKISFEMSAAEMLEDYADRSSQLKKTLWLLQIPVMLMILVYLFMVSQLNIEQEKNEIAVFKSRGAGRGQIIRIYALESLFIGIITSAISPFVGMGLCKMLGASNGFLEFVNRKALPIHIAADSFIYAGAAAAVFFFTTMLPIIPATKITIVEHKQSKAKKRKLPLWEKLCIDFILAGGSLIWLYLYTKQQNKLAQDGITDSEAAMNPMLFIASAAFIAGCGLFIIRIHPLIIRLISKLMNRVLSPAAYISFNNIGRTATGKERFLMIFLILTVSLGLYFANTARALNRNAEERVDYSVGADVVMQEQWRNSASNKNSSTADGSSVPQEGAAVSMNETANENENSDEDTENSSEEDDILYTEPPVERFENLTGVKNISKVLIRDFITIRNDQMKVPQNVKDAPVYGYLNKKKNEEKKSKTLTATDNVTLMALEPGNFSKVCWCDSRLLPVHINYYLDALSSFPQGVILSSAFESYGLKHGDTVEIKYGGNESFYATVIAFADYWPSMNPYRKAKDGSYMNFAIMNFDYVKIMTKTEPYQIWASLDDNTTTEELYDSIETEGIDLTMIRSARQEIITEKNDPMLQGMNGALTLGFIVIMIMCIIGFLMYWIISIKNRTLQFGILRAMGMKYREIIAMIIYEQLLTSGTAIFSAIFIGGIASKLYVPLFQYLYTVEKQVPGFVVIPLRSDYIKLYTIILIMLMLSFIILGILIKHINISKALKLGED